MKRNIMLFLFGSPNLGSNHSQTTGFLFFGLMLCLTVTAFLNFNVIDATAQEDRPWVLVGPAPSTNGQVTGITDREVVGAIHDVAPHPTDPDILYIGSVAGGIWRTLNATDATPVWEDLSGTLPARSIGAVAFDLTDGTFQTLVLGFARYSNFGSRGGARVGVWRSVDGGTIWADVHTTQLDGRNIDAIAARGTTLMAATDNGLWRTANGGTNWSQLSGDGISGLPVGITFDLEEDPTNLTQFYTVNRAGIYRSVDSGVNWTQVSDLTVNGLLVVATNAQLAVGSTGEVYLGIVTGGRLSSLFRSTDGSTAWTQLDTPQTTEADGSNVGIHPGNQGGRNFSIAADPGDSNVVYVAGDRQASGNPTGAINPGTGMPFPTFPNAVGAVNWTGRIFRVDSSLVAGAQATTITNNGTAGGSGPHADSRDMAFDAAGNLIEGDDGGVYRQTSPQDGTGDWFSLNGNLAVMEFHNSSWDAVSNIIIAGAQDNGVTNQAFIIGPRWANLAGGDGGDVAVDDIGSAVQSERYHSAQRLQSFRRRTFDSNNVLTASNFVPLTPPVGVPAPAVGLAAGGLFTTPFAVNAVTPTRLMVGAGNGFYESFDQGLTSVLVLAQTVNSGGSVDPIAYGAGGNAEALYVGIGDDVWIRTVAGAALTQTDPNAASASAIVDVVLDSADAQEAFAIDAAGAVYRTINAGTGWTDITGDLGTLNTGNLRAITYSTSNTDGAVIVGADNGAFIARGVNFNDWEPLGTGLPPVPVYDLEYDAADEVLLAGLLGRGAAVLNMEERDPADIVLVLDFSGSMNSPACPTCDPKVDVLKEAVEIFVKLWTAFGITEDRMGVTYFQFNVSQFDVAGDVLPPALLNADNIIADVQAKTASSATAMGGGIQTGMNDLTDITHLRNIVLLTDGMQNMNPMVIEIDDSPPAGAFHLEIDNEPGRSASNVVPTVPPTQLDSGLGIKINTIGVGAGTAFEQLLSDIASETNGVTKLTTAPDDDLRRFFVEELVQALRTFSPQLVDYRKNSLAETTGNEIFQINSGASKIVFKVSWKPRDGLSFRVIKDGVDLTSEGHFINGDFYSIFVLDFPANVGASVIESGGEWELQITGSPRASYEVAAIVDEEQLKYTMSLSQNVETGAPLKLEVNLEVGFRPILGANVRATVFKPGASLGTLLATTALPVGQIDLEPNLTLGQKKLQLLLNKPDFYQQLRPVEHTLTLKSNGNGTYSGIFEDTNLAGSYTVLYEIAGHDEEIGVYNRTEERSTVVRFGKPDKARSQISLIEKDSDSNNRLIMLRFQPRDILGNYLGPDYGHKIKVRLTEGKVSSALEDLGDGFYTVMLTVPVNTDPTLRINIIGNPLFEGPLSKAGKDDRLWWIIFGLILFFGFLIFYWVKKS